jgi:cbb3-type cytochrome oxidase maturation protein
MDVTFYLFINAFLMSMCAFCIFLWAVRDGQFRDVEATKMQLMSDAIGESPVTMASGSQH